MGAIPGRSMNSLKLTTLSKQGLEHLGGRFGYGDIKGRGSGRTSGGGRGLYGLKVRFIEKASKLVRQRGKASIGA